MAIVTEDADLINHEINPVQESDSRYFLLGPIRLLDSQKYPLPLFLSRHETDIKKKVLF